MLSTVGSVASSGCWPRAVSDTLPQPNYIGELMPTSSAVLGEASLRQLRCFLCEGTSCSSSNGISVGEKDKVVKMWREAERPYRDGYNRFACRSTEKQHTCRTRLQRLAADSPLGHRIKGVDDMARCFTVEKIQQYVDAHEPVTHRRCRGGLQSLLRFVAAMGDVLVKVKRARTDATCGLCGELVLSRAALHDIADAAKLYRQCITQLRQCLSPASCPPCMDPGASIPEVHSACRAQVCKVLGLSMQDIPAGLHCCFEEDAVHDLFMPGGTESVCVSCFRPLDLLVKAVAYWKRSVDEDALREFIETTVWPEASVAERSALRKVLQDGRFRVSTPQQLAQAGATFLESSTDARYAIGLELARTGHATVSDHTWLQLLTYLGSLLKGGGGAAPVGYRGASPAS